MATLQVEKRTYTLEEFERLPVGPPNFEFDEGEIIPVASPTLDHADIVDEINAALKTYVRARKLGRTFREVDVYLPDGKIFVPDIGFLSTQNLDMHWEGDGKIHGAPDLAVEVTSQDTSRDRVRKFHVYHANSVLWYWIVDQETLDIEEYAWTKSGYELRNRTEAGQPFHPQLFPGMEINLAASLGSGEEQVSP